MTQTEVNCIISAFRNDSTSHDQQNIELAAAMISTFEDKNINPDPDVWQLISDKELERQLGSATMGVLNRRRETMVKWMSHLLIENSVKARS